MKIQEVTIEGYQSHVQSTFKLSPGLTVITGPSDAGKTAIIRALRWFAFNEPTGEAFLHTIRNPDGSVKEAVDQARVSVTFDNGSTITKTRRKGKTTYTHSDFPTAWEKAEVPPEIRETLGLIKQQYGDFETCLNFAFQLDAPFMLAETASVGAKVLGKLAGTEIVDRSISEVNKQTHQTRTDISYADKQIGEIDVSLTEYFDLDTNDAQLTQAEEAFKKLKEDQNRRSELVALMNNYGVSTERRIRLFNEVERLAGVVVVSALLPRVEREQQKKERLETLNDSFWKAVHDQDKPLKVIRLTENLGEVDKRLSGVAEDFVNAVVTLPSLKKQYSTHAETINRAIEKVAKAAVIDVLSYKLDMLGVDVDTLNALKALNKCLLEANIEEMALRKKMDSIANLEGIRGTCKALEADYKRLDSLKRVNAICMSRELSKSAAERYVAKCQSDLSTARNNLKEAWDAAGGVCPLCGSEVENESI